MFLIVISGVHVDAVETGIEGLITAVDLERKAVEVESNWYSISEKCIIIRNGVKSSIKAIGPISRGFYQLGKLKLDGSGRVTSIQVDYSVLEGEVEEISSARGWFKLRLYQQESDCRSDIEKIYWEKSHFLKPGDYLVITVGGNKLLRVIQLESI